MDEARAVLFPRRFTIGRVMKWIAALAIVMSALISHDNFLVGMLALYICLLALAKIIIYGFPSPFGEAGTPVASESHAEETNRIIEEMYQQAIQLRDEGRLDESIDLLDEMEKERPDAPAVVILRGTCYRRKGELKRAIELLEAAVALHPEVAVIHYNLACYWCLIGDDVRALTHLDVALSLQPDLRSLIATDLDLDAIRDRKEFSN